MVSVLLVVGVFDGLRKQGGCLIGERGGFQRETRQKRKKGDDTTAQRVRFPIMHNHSVR